MTWLQFQTLAQFFSVLSAVIISGCGSQSSTPAFVGVWQSGDRVLMFTAGGEVSEYLPPPPPEVAALQLVRLSPLNGTWTLRGKTIHVACADGPPRDFDWKINDDGNCLTLTSRFGDQTLEPVLFLRQSRSALAPTETIPRAISHH